MVEQTRTGNSSNSTSSFNLFFSNSLPCFVMLYDVADRCDKSLLLLLLVQEIILECLRRWINRYGGRLTQKRTSFHRGGST
jgi:hypothetical protein